MKLYYSDQLGYAFHDGSVLKSSLLDNCLFRKENNDWILNGYSTERFFLKNINLDDENIEVFSEQGKYSYGSSIAKLDTINPNSLIAVRGQNVVYYGDDNGVNSKVISESQGCISSYEGQFLGVYVSDKGIYFQGRRANSSFQKRDFNLELIWKYDLARSEAISLTPTHYRRCIIYVIPSKRGRPNQTKILFLNDDVGKDEWVASYPFKAQDYALSKGRILIAALEGFYVLDFKKKEILHSWKVDYKGGGGSGLNTHNVNIYHDEGRIFMCHSPLGVLYIFDLYDYSMIKEVSLPQGIHIDSFMGKDETSGLYYFHASQPKKEVGNTFLLELDPNNLDAPIEFEPTPDISSRFVAAEGTPEQCELHIDITTESLDDAIRFGEITVRKLAMQHSLSLLRSGPCLAEQGLKQDERFNGTIRLVLHDVQGDTAQIDEYLATLKQRVDEWAAGFDTLVGWFKNPDTGGYIRTQVFPRRAGQPEQVRILPKGNPFAKYELDDFVSDLESDTLKLDNKHYVARLTELTEAITSEQSSPQDMATASYFQGALACMNNDEQAALEHYFTAAQQGCFTGVLSYMDLGGTPQPGQPLFTLVAAYNLIGQDAWSAQEDIDASTKRLTDSERHELDNAAQAIVDNWQRNDVKSFNLV
ncbi:hypothetical protein [Pseudoalteromonas ruthenica]|uniref:hypothetical protein n=1 Tax=Pseudoalteromonas ruthenica TaxID=151081 RepID=UPI00110A2A57|nr:hypothetical protein [Pseudoalteromonas ruthenica]TMO49964.1 hypothetical protein CWC24_00665 [Pseudoalteromonas ruthenica]TMO50642.1 hypothetical protein CWC23_11145 [Pseudoalteromonas ruthenica]